LDSLQYNAPEGADIVPMGLIIRQEIQCRVGSPSQTLRYAVWNPT